MYLVIIKRLDQCTLVEAAEAGRKGFQDYYVKIDMTVDQLVAMLSSSGMSPSLSVVAFVDGSPAGIILNAIRTIDGKKIAWNGATAVAPEYRRTGVAGKLMDATMEIYQKENVDIAMLESFSKNKKAIELYERFGYKITDKLIFLEHLEQLKGNPFFGPSATTYELRKGIPQDVQHLSYYQQMAPWKTQWQSIRNGESLLIIDGGDIIGYALYQRVFKKDGELASVILYQCEADPERKDGEEIVVFAASQLFAPYHLAYKKTTFNMPSTNKRLVKILESAGFTHALTKDGVPLEQVHMMKEMG